VAENLRRLFLCRHAKSEANEKGLYCGGMNESPLSETGKKQAILLGKALREYYEFQGKLIISSFRERAKKTAEIIARTFYPSPFILTMENLREIDGGEWEGKTQEEVGRIYPKECEEWYSGFLKPDFRFPGGESMEEAQKRVENGFGTIKKIWLGDRDEKNNDLIIVAHSGVNVIILTKIMDSEIKTYGFRIFRQDNACINIIGFREKTTWRPATEIILINSPHHLDCKLT